MAGLDYVSDAMDDAQVSRFVEHAIFDEMVPVLTLPKDELASFSRSVFTVSVILYSASEIVYFAERHD